MDRVACASVNDNKIKMKMKKEGRRRGASIFVVVVGVRVWKKVCNGLVSKFYMSKCYTIHIGLGLRIWRLGIII